MTANAFINQIKPPTDAELGFVLGPARATWDDLLTAVAQECGATDREWKRHSPKSGWALRAMRNGRTILWLAPSHACFTVMFILGQAAMSAARQTRLPQRVRQIINTAPKYPEGTGVRLRVKSHRDIAAMRELAIIRLTH